jgi:dissimilatory sulfite reductase (desulfoviridin) alpha/beta subunit
MDSGCPTRLVTVVGMKIKTIGKRIVNTAKVINRFGSAWLIRRANGRHELIGGTVGDFTAAKEWASLFAHDIVFSRPVKREQQRRFPFAARLG